MANHSCTNPRRLWLLLGGIALGLWACDTPPPTEAEIHSRLMGSYCADQVSLTLGDSTYQREHRYLGPLNAGWVRESCKGRYTLDQDSLGSWHLRFFADEWPSGMENCAAEWVIWTTETGYAYDQGDSVNLPDPVSDAYLVKGGCGS